MNIRPQMKLDIALADLKAIKNFQLKHPEENKGYFIRYEGIYGTNTYPYGIYLENELQAGAEDFLMLIQEGLAGPQSYTKAEDILKQGVELVEDIEAYKKEKVLYISEVLKEISSTEYLDSFLDILIK